MTTWKLYIAGIDPLNEHRVLLVNTSLYTVPSPSEVFQLGILNSHGNRVSTTNGIVTGVDSSMKTINLNIDNSSLLHWSAMFLVCQAVSWFDSLPPYMSPSSAQPTAITAAPAAYSPPANKRVWNGFDWEEAKLEIIPVTVEPECHCSSRELASTGHDPHCLYFMYRNNKRNGGNSGGSHDVSN